MSEEKKCNLRVSFNLSRQPIVTCETCGRADFDDAPKKCKREVDKVLERAAEQGTPFGGLTRG